MRIAFITSEFPIEGSDYGGLATYIAKISKLLVQAGHTVDIYTLADVEPFKIDHFGATVYGVSSKWLSFKGIAHLDTLIPSVFRPTYFDLKDARSLYRECIKQFSKCAYDVIQVANVRSVGLFFDTTKYPVLMRLSSYRRLWDRLAGVPAGRRESLRCWLEEKSITQQKSIYSPTRYVAQLTENNLSLTDGAIKIIHTPFVRVDNAGSYKPPSINRPYFLFFGRLSMMKGVHILIDATIEVFKKYQEIDLVFVGKSEIGPEKKSMRNYILERSKDYRERLHLFDAIPHRDLFPVIEQAEFVVMPSLADNLPNALLETLSFGKRVIATSGSCFEEHLTNPDAGVLVEPGNVPALTQAIENMIKMPDKERRIMEEAAREQIDALAPARIIPLVEVYFREFINARNAQQRI